MLALVCRTKASHPLQYFWIESPKGIMFCSAANSYCHARKHVAQLSPHLGQGGSRTIRNICTVAHLLPSRRLVGKRLRLGFACRLSLVASLTTMSLPTSQACKIVPPLASYLLPFFSHIQSYLLFGRQRFCALLRFPKEIVVTARLSYLSLAQLIYTS